MISLFLLLSATINLCLCSNKESELIQHLLPNINTLSRPVAHHGDTLVLHIDFSLRQLLEVNEKGQTLTSNIWLRQQWKDVNLQWNATDFGNVTSLRIPLNKIWKPDLTLYNMADMDGSNCGNDGPPAHVDQSGLIVSWLPLIVKSSCKMDVTWFPFDTQKCVLVYGSWTYSAREMDIQLYSNDTQADLSELVAHGQWNIIEATIDRRERRYDCCPLPFINFHFTLRLKRRRLYYLFNLIVPCGLIGFLALLGFTLPPDSGEKLSLGVTVLFSLIVFLNMIAESMPANSDAVPLLGTYFNCVMVMIASSVISTIIVNLNQRSLRPLKAIQGRPRQIFLSWLPKMLLMSPLDEPKSSKVSQVAVIQVLDVLEHSINKDHVAQQRMEKRLKQLNILEEPSDTEIKKRLELDSAERTSVKREWKFVAIVVDRLFFSLSIVFVLIAITVLLVSAA